MPRVCKNWLDFNAHYNKNVIYPEKTKTDIFLDELYRALKQHNVEQLCFPNSNIHFIAIIKWYLVSASQCYTAIQLDDEQFTDSVIFPSPFFDDKGQFTLEKSTLPSRNKPNYRLTVRLMAKYIYINVRTNFDSLRFRPAIFLKNLFQWRWIVCVEPNALASKTFQLSGRPVISLPSSFFLKNHERKSSNLDDREDFLEKFDACLSSLESFLGSCACEKLKKYSVLWLENFFDQLDGVAVRDFGLELLFIGRQCSDLGSALIAQFYRKIGVHVVTFDHGSGNAHQCQKSVHWVEYSNSDMFVTTNSFVAEQRQRGFSKDYVFSSHETTMVGWRSFASQLAVSPSKDVMIEISSSNSALSGAAFPLKISAANKQKCYKPFRSLDITNIDVLYIGTAYHGWRSRLRPINNDGEYYRWQNVLLNFFADRSRSMHYRPHPEGATKPPTVLLPKKIQILTGDFESIRLEDYGLIVFDFIFSSVMPQIFQSNIPLLFFNTGFPQLTRVAENMISRNVNYASINISNSEELLFEQIDQKCKKIFAELTGREVYESYFNFDAD